MNEDEKINYTEVDYGNMNVTSSTDNRVVEEEWDLSSPLLLQSNNEERSIPSDDNATNQLEQLEEEEVEDYIQQEEFVSDVHPKEFYITLLAAIFVMTFIILVAGSYFFEWSDTILRVQVDTVTADMDDTGSYTFGKGQQLSVDLVSQLYSQSAVKAFIFSSVHFPNWKSQKKYHQSLCIQMLPSNLHLEYFNHPIQILLYF